MTKDKQRVLSIMAEGREYNAGDIETLAKARGMYLGTPRQIGRIMVELRRDGLIDQSKVEWVAVYRKVEKVTT